MPLLHLVSPLIGLAESGRLPDGLVRAGIRNLLRSRFRELHSATDAERQAAAEQLRQATASGPIAVVPERANEQHYEVPAEFFRAVLGPHLKYSSGFWDNASSLQDAEAAALAATCAHAELTDGQAILELGCGWGSLTLWMARQYPNSRITAVSNSSSQREFILAEAASRGLHNVEVLTCDINTFQAEPGSCDRVVSVEMFEHVRNHALLMNRIAHWLRPSGKLFVHIFCHRSTPYLFEDTGPAAWMARTFFSGGMMPSRDWLSECDHPLSRERLVEWNGRHYERTCNAWLRRMDDGAADLVPVLQQTYGRDWKLWRQRWRMFFMACAELFGFDDGNEWLVTHSLFIRPR